MTTAQIPKIKPLRSVNFKETAHNIKELPLVENVEKRKEILKKSLQVASRIKVI
ncbi:hypothetical protein AB0Y20_01530 [Heyndrickxia oleronia]|uniref:hypothetical protein n=1 Tax=Heyndrickxia oleronia TaxID=38875 RepID=UPI003F26F4E2